MSKSVWILGGAQSGKTHFAELIGQEFSKVGYIGTAQPHEESELKERIALLKSKRPAHWIHVDAPFQIDSALLTLKSCEIVIFDCMTQWLAWKMTDAFPKYNLEQLRTHLEHEFQHLCQTLFSAQQKIIVISNEVGQGVVPSQESGRAFRDMHGLINQIGSKKAHLFCQIIAGQCILLRDNRISSPEPQILKNVTNTWIAKEIRS